MSELYRDQSIAAMLRHLSEHISGEVVEVSGKLCRVAALGHAWANAQGEDEKKAAEDAITGHYAAWCEKPRRGLAGAAAEMGYYRPHVAEAACEVDS